MKHFKFYPASASPKLIDGQSVILLRNSEDPNMRIMMFGTLMETSARSHLDSHNTKVFDVSLKIANMWVDLAESDIIFVYDSSALETHERVAIMDAVSGVMTGHFGPEDSEVEEAVTSILGTYGQV